MKKLTKNQVMMLHHELILETGGSDGREMKVCWIQH